ncbi:MAG: hypothetical protein IKW74_06105, partial [Thermoguttaceae bacterium]|nr:hypothetical protein [Thermoguttaceae bacterium]
EGVFRSAPTMNSVDVAGGTVLLAYEGRGSQEGEPFIRLAGSNSTVKGINVVYPEWNREDLPPVPYPPCIESSDTDNVAVLDCCLLNPYEGIKLVRAARHLVRNITGYPIYRGLFVDQCYDIGRVENIHFWPFGVVYKIEDPYCAWINKNGVAMEFARTDWHYVMNTFCFGYGVGYKFSEYGHGGANGNFVGLGADSCSRAVLVEQAQLQGLLIVNGEFVGRWGSDDSICVEITEQCLGKVCLSNCAFWGPNSTCIQTRGKNSQLSADSCQFIHWDILNRDNPAIDIQAGRAVIQGCSFDQPGYDVRVGKDAGTVILSSNLARGGFNVTGDTKHVVQSANEPESENIQINDLKNYQFKIGDLGDFKYLKNWFAPEEEPGPPTPGHSTSADEPDKPVMIPCRWSGSNSQIILPVVPDTAYRIQLHLNVPEGAVQHEEETGIYLQNEKLASLQTGPQWLTVRVPAQKSEYIKLEIRCTTWVPMKIDPNSQDFRKLGVRGFEVRVVAE